MYIQTIRLDPSLNVGFFAGLTKGFLRNFIFCQFNRIIETLTFVIQILKHLIIYKKTFSTLKKIKGLCILLSQRKLLTLT